MGKNTVELAHDFYIASVALEQIEDFIQWTGDSLRTDGSYETAAKVMRVHLIPITMRGHFVDKSVTLPTQYLEQIFNEVVSESLPAILEAVHKRARDNATNLRTALARSLAGLPPIREVGDVDEQELPRKPQ